MKFLAFADLHLRESRPVCRPDDEDWIKTQERVINFIAETAEKENVDQIIIAGDVFDSWKNKSMFFLNKCATWLQRLSMNVGVMAIPGNHDFYSTDLKVLESTPYGLFTKFGIWFDPDDYWFASKYLHIDKEPKPRDKLVCVVHRCLYLNEKPYPGIPETGNVEYFVKHFIRPNCRLVISGDNHQPFVCQIDDTLVVNCGSVFRMRSQQANYTPAVWLCEVDKNRANAKPIYIPLECKIKSHFITNNTLKDVVGDITGTFEVGEFSDNFKNLVKDDIDKTKLILKFEGTLR